MNTLDSRGHRVMTDSLPMMLREREFNGAGRVFQKAAQVTESMIKRLGQITLLDGHQGCVNCLEWSPNGNLLVSGSDDTKVIIWDPMRKKEIIKLQTRHIGNIFSVKFLPQTNCSQIVTGAGDTLVTVLNVEVASSSQTPPRPLLYCRCHNGRVKRIATAPDLPDIFWTASEDGLVLQYDLREPHECATFETSSSGAKILVDLYRHAGGHSEAKCVSVNPTRTHLIAVGANDAFARLFDRRMIKTSVFRNDRYVDDREECLAKLSVPDTSVPQECAKYFAPGHLHEDGWLQKYATTFVTFSPEGNEMLVNLGGDHIYLYDINRVQDVTLAMPQEVNRPLKLNNCCEELSNEASFIDPKSASLNPSCSCDYIRRADALQQRGWSGDYHAAARDYHKALTLRGLNRGCRPLLGVVTALYNMQWFKAAQPWQQLLRKHFPKEAGEFVNISSKPAASEPGETMESLISVEETKWRATASDYQDRFVGHCNTTTDIKEAAFIGPMGNYIAAGSDDGALFIWKRDTTALTTVLRADTSIVNCVQPHPATCLLATSGIENVIKLWQPLSDNTTKNSYAVEDIDRAAEANQHCIAINPFDTIDMVINRIEPRLQQQLPVCQTS